ncbi:conserved hypothetical protein [Neospora caninum Liverpool]|uniref:Uncharacterized protein n=1 Tax=Neospora caninum (strain Liverpool) TaxID=572307 RepID=F0VCU8_NEOCL|nr:conserved hypothetical protein [Neospora caninum Liverpool]CBZ51463.1 conserved hypothetical protein [Neospora caninum Liverpool]CEL65412.1 TPA: hypothetical protein BN1204_012610 [Neospora caninum Liverpool]|eukprot:XP_003881496.1 conserved hypothetical protein [Neospora caninum Liverpool]
MTTPRATEVESGSTPASATKELPGAQEGTEGSTPAPPRATPNQPAAREPRTRPGEASSLSNSSPAVAKAARPSSAQSPSATRTPGSLARDGAAAGPARQTSREAETPLQGSTEGVVRRLRQDSGLSRTSSTTAARHPFSGRAQSTPAAAHAIEVRGELVVQNVATLEELTALLEDENSPFSLQLQDVELRVGPNQVARLGAAVPALHEHLRAIQREQEESLAQQRRGAGAAEATARGAASVLGVGRARATGVSAASSALRTNVVLRGAVEGRRSAVARSRIPSAAAATRSPIAGAAGPGGSSRAAPPRRVLAGSSPSPGSTLPSATEVRAARAQAASAEAGSLANAQEQSQSLLARLSEVQKQVKSLLATEGVVSGDAKKGKEGKEGAEGAKKGAVGGDGTPSLGKKPNGRAKDFSADSVGVSSSSRVPSSAGGELSDVPEKTRSDSLAQTEKEKAEKEKAEKEKAEKEKAEKEKAEKEKAEKEKAEKEKAEKEKAEKEKAEKEKAEKEKAEKEKAEKEKAEKEGALAHEDKEEEVQLDTLNTFVGAIGNMFRGVFTSDAVDETGDQGEAPTVEDIPTREEPNEVEKAEEEKKEPEEKEEATTSWPW